MHYYPEDQTEENLKKLIRDNVCTECGRQLSVYLDVSIDAKYIACSGQRHEGITREYQPPIEDYRSNIRREIELEQKHGREASKALATIPKQGQLTQPQAEHILSLVYPDCPADERIRCAILCRDFGLHPLLKEVYLIPFKNKKTGKDDYATVLGINATRKLMARRGTYSYFDDTPRLMTDEEQMRIFGAVDKNNIVAITKLRSKSGLEAPGYGRWPNDKSIYGEDKGNTKVNMAFIRSERNAFGRLSPDALPQGVEVIDEAYVEGIGEVNTKTGEIIEGEAIEVEPSPPADSKPTEVIKSEAIEPAQEEAQPTSIIDLGWLKESLTILQGKGIKAYSDESMLSYMKVSYKVEGTDIYAIASELDKSKAAHLVKVIQDALDKA